MKHTPRPWYYTSGAVWTTPNGPDDGGQCIARRDGDSDIPPAERDANLRLCATAPELLEACRDALLKEDNHITPRTATLLSEAIAQAGGGQS